MPHPAVPRPWLALAYLEGSSSFSLSHSLSLFHSPCYQLTLLESREGLLEFRRAASKNKRYVPLTFLSQCLLYGPNKQVAFIALKDNAANIPPFLHIPPNYVRSSSDLACLLCRKTPDALSLSLSLSHSLFLFPQQLVRVLFPDDMRPHLPHA